MIVVTDEAARAACVVWHRLLLAETVKPEDVRPDAVDAMRAALEAGLAKLEDAGEPLEVSRDRLGRVAGRCPACRSRSLFLGVGGRVTCSRLDCPNPALADEQLDTEADVAQHPTRIELAQRLADLVGHLRGAGMLSTANTVDGIRAVIDGPAPLDVPRPDATVTAAEAKRREERAYADGFNAATVRELGEQQTGRDRVSMPWPEPSLAEVLNAVNRVGVLVEQAEPPGVQELVRRTGALTTRIDRLIDHQIESGQRIGAILGPVMGETPDDTIAGLIDGAKVEQRTAFGRLERLLHDQQSTRLEDGQLVTELGQFERDRAYFWDAALGMAGERSTPDWDYARIRREARWFYAELLAGPEDQGCVECHRGPDQPHDERCDRYRPAEANQPHPYQGESGMVCEVCGNSPMSSVHNDVTEMGKARPIARDIAPHIFSGAAGRTSGACWVRGCGRPLTDDVHKVPGNGGALRMPGTGFISGGPVSGGEPYALQPGERIAFRNTTPPDPDDLPAGL